MELKNKMPDSKDRQQVWMELDFKGETSYCEDCGTKIWQFWFNPSLQQDNRKEARVNYPLMTECAPCLFEIK